MTANDGKTAIGFLTVVEHPTFGLCGGYLVLNANGRPLEFHCTAPIKPNRAQQILYGPTLEPYLYGEQIGRTLVSKGGVKPVAVCTDLAPVLAMRPLVAMPVMLALDEQSVQAAPAASTDEATPQLRFDRPQLTSSVPLAHFRLGEQAVAVESMHGGDRELLVQRLGSIAQSLDFNEPFGRIREALEEAQRGGKA